MKRKPKLRETVGTDRYVVTPKVQADRDRQSLADMAKSGGTSLKRGRQALSDSDKAERDSYKLNRKYRF